MLAGLRQLRESLHSRIAVRLEQNQVTNQGNAFQSAEGIAVPVEPATVGRRREAVLANEARHDKRLRAT